MNHSVHSDMKLHNTYCRSGMIVIVGIRALNKRKLLSAEFGPRPIWNGTLTDKLKQDLLLNYDKFARPTEHFNTTTVRFGITVRHVDIDEMKSTMVVYAWLQLVRILHFTLLLVQQRNN